MLKNSIIRSVKRQEEEKVPFSLKLPASLKEQLQQIGEAESISMNSLIVATLQSMIDDECGKELDNLQTVLDLAKEQLLSAMEALYVSDEEYEYAISIFDPESPPREYKSRHTFNHISKFIKEYL